MLSQGSPAAFEEHLTSQRSLVRAVAATAAELAAQARFRRAEEEKRQTLVAMRSAQLGEGAKGSAGGFVAADESSVLVALQAALRTLAGCLSLCGQGPQAPSEPRAGPGGTVLGPDGGAAPALKGPRDATFAEEACARLSDVLEAVVEAPGCGPSTERESVLLVLLAARSAFRAAVAPAKTAVGTLVLKLVVRFATREHASPHGAASSAASAERMALAVVRLQGIGEVLSVALDECDADAALEALEARLNAAATLAADEKEEMVSLFDLDESEALAAEATGNLPECSDTGGDERQSQVLLLPRCFGAALPVVCLSSALREPAAAEWTSLLQRAVAEEEARREVAQAVATNHTQRARNLAKAVVLQLESESIILSSSEPARSLKV